MVIFISSRAVFSKAFAIFCGMAIHNTSVYEDVQKAMAKQRVAFEVRFL